MHKVLVTGGAGFIGSHLVEELVKRGFKVVVIDNLSTGSIKNLSHVINKISFYEDDICSSKIFKYFNQINYVFHLAALADIVPSINDPKKYFNANVCGTENVLNICLKKKINKFIYAASSSCYGIPNNLPTSENDKIDTRYPYALTKWMGEQLTMHYGNVYKIPVVSLRLFNVYGNRSRTSGAYGAVFGVFLKQKLEKKPFTVVGSGNQKRDFTFISDVVSAFVAAMKVNIKQKIYNVGSGRTVSINKIVKILNGKVIYIPKRPGEPDCTFANIKKIKKELKWNPKIRIEEGVKKMLENINYWKQAPLWTPKSISNATKMWFKYLK
jgi:UDP-glucose 4-epimerase